LSSIARASWGELPSCANAAVESHLWFLALQVAHNATTGPQPGFALVVESSVDDPATVTARSVVVADCVSRSTVAPIQKLTRVSVHAEHPCICRCGKGGGTERYSQHGCNGSK